MLDEFFSDDDMTAAQAGVMGLVDTVARRLLLAGKVSSAHEGLDWTTRLLRLEEECPDAPLMLITAGVLPPGLQRLCVCCRVGCVCDRACAPAPPHKHAATLCAHTTCMRTPHECFGFIVVRALNQRLQRMTKTHDRANGQHDR